ncbi:DUF2326 domain-containing protein [Pantoea allii]|uniref:DUF2326 domain-containing protein n=1 Tax=Pantoea allii TaxID=574096 RepID=UPI0024B69CEE|nr:DUF2326 domain-containing protein [Pantoea allii]MDJ0035343.1 DUF2326 domain-containing protein [Pantoea allii]
MVGWFMRLNKLTILKNKSIIREVTFKDGLNIILNKRASGKESGNSVGKSTLSRVLDYLFMSSGSDIYHDAEFGKDITEIVSLIEDNVLEFKLDFKTVENKNSVVSRVVSTDEKKSKFYIENVESDKKSYVEYISKNVFGLTSEKPTLRNVSHKFIRNTNEKMQMTLYFLHVNTTSDVYDLLYLFLFGFNGLPLIKKKSDINKEIKKQKSYLAAYRNPHRETVLSKMVKPLKKEISEAEKSIENFDFKDSHDKSLKELADIQSVISNYSLTYASLSMRIRNIEDSISALKNNITKAVQDDLVDIYNSAGVYFSGELKKSYEEMVLFHNDVIKNKINFLEFDLFKKRNEADSINKEINRLHELESSFFKTIKEPETLKSITQLYNKLTELRENLASIEANLTRINDTIKFISSLEEQKETLLEEIDMAVHGLERNIEIFNEFFGDLTKEIYGERYIFDLSFDKEKGKCNLNISCITPNSTGGKKKGEITAFDFAYIKFVNKLKLKRPTFVIHDSIEDVDANQIRDIFNEANELQGQYIVSILSDKFSSIEDLQFVEENSILELSSKDKFFKI